MRAPLQSASAFFSGIGLGLLWTFGFAERVIDVLAVGIVVVVLAAPISRAVLFTAGLALLAETVSPFAPFVWSIALFGTLGCLRIFTRRHVNSHTTIGAGVATIFGVIILQLWILTLTRWARYFSAGWIPEITRAYLYFSIGRAMLTSLAVAGMFRVRQIFSPRARGILITRG